MFFAKRARQSRLKNQLKRLDAEIDRYQARQRSESHPFNVSRLLDLHEERLFILNKMG